MSASDELITRLAEWLDGRDEIFELVVKWPPLTRVTSTVDTPLMVPAPGVEGVVMSYDVGGADVLGVVAPMFGTLTSPHTGETINKGDEVLAQCNASSLEVLGYGDYEPEDVVRAIEELKRA